MTRRPAVTLMEVLIAMFVMAIGMMALMALFPVGAVSMAQALKDDRCAYAASMAENTAQATNLRYGDACVNWALNPLNPAVSLSGLVYVDPYGVEFLSTTITPYGPPLAGVIPRIAPAFVYSQPPPLTVPLPGTFPNSFLIDRWFSLPDDIGFNLSGTPDTSNTGGVIDRGRRYSFAYLLHQQPPLALSGTQLSPMKTVQLDVVVYNGRPTNSMTIEVPLPAAGTVGTNGIVIPAPTTTAKRGGWILDISPIPGTGLINGYFYRVTNVAQNVTPSGITTTIEVQQNLIANVSQIVVMDYVAEVFGKGIGWQQ